MVLNPWLFMTFTVAWADRPVIIRLDLIHAAVPIRRNKKKKSPLKALLKILVRVVAMTQRKVNKIFQILHTVFSYTVHTAHCTICTLQCTTYYLLYLHMVRCTKHCSKVKSLWMRQIWSSLFIVSGRNCPTI
jgi:hypothetical protein